MKRNVILDKTFEFSKDIVLICQYLAQEKHEYVLSRQLLRAGTSVGANTSEGVPAMSRKEFSHKLNIAYKEARECWYWLNLIYETGYLETKMVSPLKIKCDEIIRILCAILRTTAKNST